MFEQKDALPRTKLHFPRDDRHRLARVCQYHPDMRWHIVAPFRTVREVAGVFGHNPVEELFEIVARGRIGIFHDYNAATGVLNKHRHGPIPHSGPTYLRLHIIGDFVQSFTFCAKFELVVMDMHYSADY